MSVTHTETRTLDRVTEILGSAMMLAWTFIIGIGGFLLLAATAYAMIAQIHSLAIFCICLLSAPLLMTVAWGILSLASELDRRLVPSYGFLGQTWWEIRPAHRIVYQAYFL